MPKEWILNSATNRFQLNYKKNVGAVSESIRKCAPKNLAEWESYYFSNVWPKEHLIQLGKKLYVKVSEVLAAHWPDRPGFLLARDCTCLYLLPPDCDFTVCYGNSDTCKSET